MVQENVWLINIFSFNWISDIIHMVEGHIFIIMSLDFIKDILVIIWPFVKDEDTAERERILFITVIEKGRETSIAFIFGIKAKEAPFNEEEGEDGKTNIFINILILNLYDRVR